MAGFCTKTMQAQHTNQELQQICQGIEAELAALDAEEQRIDSELGEYFTLIAGSENNQNNHSSKNGSKADHRNGSSKFNRKYLVDDKRSGNGSSGSSISSSGSSGGSDIRSIVGKIGDDFAPSFEAMQQDARKMAEQIEECRALSERLSRMVRRLDVMQMRAHETLACTEDIINLKDCKARIINAIEAHNLAQVQPAAPTAIGA